MMGHAPESGVTCCYWERPGSQWRLPGASICHSDVYRDVQKAWAGGEIAARRLVCNQEVRLLQLVHALPHFLLLNLNTSP